MISATINNYRLKFYNNKELILNIKTSSLKIPKENNLVTIDNNIYIVRNIEYIFYSNKDTNRYPSIEYKINIEEFKEEF